MGEEDLCDEDIDPVESFTCSMFGYSKLTSIKEGRYLHIKSKCKPKEAAEPLDCLKNVDPCLFRLCKQVLMQQIKISLFIAKLYKNSAVADLLAKYTLNWLTVIYVLNGLMVNKFLTAQKMTTIESWNIANEYVETDDEGSEDGDSDGDDDEMNDQD